MAVESPLPVHVVALLASYILWLRTGRNMEDLILPARSIYHETMNLLQSCCRLSDMLEKQL